MSEKDNVSNEVNARTYTIAEIRTFIEAVEFSADQEEDFVPSQRVWQRLREMIFNVREPAHIQSAVRGYEPYPQITEQPAAWEAPAARTVPIGNAVPAGPSSLGGSAPVRHNQAQMPAAFSSGSGILNARPTDGKQGGAFQ